jgi:kinesin family protein 5
LDPSKANLSVHEDKTRGIYVEGLTEMCIANEGEVYNLMKEGNANRAVGVTNMNAQSSRSHSIFIMSVTMNDLENFSCKTGKLYLVDLAGSEMISKTGATGQTLEEAKGINKSLTMLGRVINALTDGKTAYIPYRDSKLTRILQESLGGNSKTCLIITASPSMYNAAETLSTCRFGMRAKSIKNNAKINKQLTVAELKLVVTRLENELQIRDRRVHQLESMIVSLGVPIPGDDATFKPIEENETQPTEESDDASSKKGQPQTPAQVQAQAQALTATSTSTADAGVGAASGPSGEDQKRDDRKPEVIIKLMSDELGQQKDKQKVTELEREKQEQGRDLDTLIDQLKQERKKLKIKDGRLYLLKKQLADKSAEIERMERENNTLIQNAVESKLNTQKFEEDLALKVRMLHLTSYFRNNKSPSSTTSSAHSQPTGISPRFRTLQPSLTPNPPPNPPPELAPKPKQEPEPKLESGSEQE